MAFDKRDLGLPDLKIGNFEMWVKGRPFPDAENGWDENWLDIIAHCSERSAAVSVEGVILQLSELQKWLLDCKAIYASLSGEAHLDCLEPNIDVNILMQKTGQCELLVSITPDHLYQKHLFEFHDIDQSHLPSLIQHLEKILNTYPIRGLIPAK